MKLTHEVFQWQDLKQTHQAFWHAENGALAPKKCILADDTLTADSAFKLASQGVGLLWQGDFQLARQLLQAIARRCDRPVKKLRKSTSIANEVEIGATIFNQYRQAQSQRARILSMLLIPLNADYTIPLKRAPDVVDACTKVYGKLTEASSNSIVSLRELQGLIGANEWHKKGVVVPELGARIHPHYGVFSPVRGEYISLVANTKLPAINLAFDIGTGTGVLAAMLAKRGVQRIIATDQDHRALACAQENVQRLGYADQIEVISANLFPEGKSPLIVCNPPWIPARPSSPIEYAIFDPGSQMLRGFLAGLSNHLTENGEGWLLLSDLAEHLKLRTRAELMRWISQAGLRVIERIDVKPNHPKVADQTNLLHQARAAEVTSLWRLTTNFGKNVGGG